MEFEGFALKKHDMSHEAQSLAVYCALNRLRHRSFQRACDIPKNWVPVGTIEWVEAYLGFTPLPDHYPDFVKHLITRKIWVTNKWPLKQRVFVKPGHQQKRFNGFVTNGTYKGKRGHGPYICSEVVKFQDEWRYYVANGKVLASGWYYGTIDEEKPAPPCPITPPSDWVGSIDIGILENGKLELVECSGPYATGWYGSSFNSGPYFEWLVEGWRYLNR